MLGLMMIDWHSLAVEGPGRQSVDFSTRLEGF